MKKNELVKSVNLTFNRIGFQLQRRARRFWSSPAWSAW